MRQFLLLLLWPDVIFCDVYVVFDYSIYYGKTHILPYQRLSRINVPLYVLFRSAKYVMICYVLLSYEASNCTNEPKIVMRYCSYVFFSRFVVRVICCSHVL